MFLDCLVRLLAAFATPGPDARLGGVRFVYGAWDTDLQRLVNAPRERWPLIIS